MSWFSVKPTGSAPKPRTNHTLTLISPSNLPESILSVAPAIGGFDEIPIDPEISPPVSTTVVDTTAEDVDTDMHDLKSDQVCVLSVVHLPKVYFIVLNHFGGRLPYFPAVLSILNQMSSIFNQQHS